MASDENTKGTMKMIGRAGAAAVKKTAAKAGLDVFVNVMKKVLLKANLPEEMINNEITTRVLSIVAPMVFGLIAHQFGEKIDELAGSGKSGLLASGAEQALEVALTEAGFDLVEILKENVFPMMGELFSGLKNASEPVLGIAGEEKSGRAREA